MNQFDQRVGHLATVYQIRIHAVLERDKEKVLSPASVALFVSGILSHVHRVDDAIMATFERVPEFLCLVDRVTAGITVGDTVKFVMHPEKPFFGVIVNNEGLVLSYRAGGQERGLHMDAFKELKAQLSPLEIAVYRRKEVITND